MVLLACLAFQLLFSIIQKELYSESRIFNSHLVNIQSGIFLIPIFLRRMKSCFKLSKYLATLLKSKAVWRDNQMKTALHSINLVFQFNLSNLIHISKNKARPLMWVKGSMLHFNRIIPQRESVNISYFVMLALLFFLKIESSCLLSVRVERDFSFLIFSSIYCHKPFILQSL